MSQKGKFEHTIFICYKRSLAEQVFKPENIADTNQQSQNNIKYPIKNVGVSIARMIKQSFEKNGYKDIFLDCDENVKEEERVNLLGKSRLVLILLTGYSFVETKEATYVPNNDFKNELDEIKKLWDANRKNENCSKTKILAINIDNTFSEEKDYGDYNWVKEVLEASYFRPKNEKRESEFRTAAKYSSDFNDLLYMIKYEWGILPSRLSYNRMKKLVIWMTIALFALLVPVVFSILLGIENDKLSNMPDAYGEGIVHEYTKSQGVKYEYIDYEHMANPSLDLLKNYFWCDSSSDATGNCSIVFTTKKVKDSSVFMNSHQEFSDNSCHLLEFEIGSVDLTVYVCKGTQKEWGIKGKEDLFDDLLESKGLFNKPPTKKYYVMAGVDGTGDWYLNMLYEHYKKRTNTDSMALDEFRKIVFDAEFHPVNDYVKGELQTKLDSGYVILVLENTTVKKDNNFLILINDSVQMDQKLPMYAYTLVTIKYTPGETTLEFEFSSNQNVFFDQLVAPDTNYKKITSNEKYEKEFIIHRKSKWAK